MERFRIIMIFITILLTFSNINIKLIKDFYIIKIVKSEYMINRLSQGQLL